MSPLDTLARAFKPHVLVNLYLSNDLQGIYQDFLHVFGLEIF